MIFILKSINSMNDLCNSVVLYGILNVVRKSLNLIMIMGPILAMVSLAISFVMLTVNPEEQKYKARIKNSMLALIILFMIPALVNLIMGLPSIEDNTTVGACWKSVESNKQK